MASIKTIQEEKPTKLSMYLCQGRHEIPEAKQGAIYPGEVNPLDVEGLESQAFRALWDACERSGLTHVSETWDGYDMEPHVINQGTRLDLYVTGLTVALIAVLNVCKQEGLVVTLYHFDRETGQYYPQHVE